MKIEDQITIIETVKILERIERRLNDGLAWLKVVAIASVLCFSVVSVALGLLAIRASFSF